MQLRAINHLRTGTGEPLLLIHGIGSSLRCWSPVMPHLAANHDVIAVDLPGFGESRPLPAGAARTVPSLVDAVEALLDSLGLETVHIAGNSMGGWIALELARRLRARTVVAISPAGLGTPAENRRSRVTLATMHAVARLLGPVAGPVCRPSVARAVLYGLFAGRPTRIEDAELAYAMRALASAPGFTATLDWLFCHNAAGLGEIKVPVSVLWGSRDRILSPRQAARFAAAIRGCDVHPLAGLGHIPMSDDPTLIANSILAVTAGGIAHATSTGATT
jgi:pimeloyl-ACP methyl ester carboxylesterase